MRAPEAIPTTRQNQNTRHLSVPMPGSLFGFRITLQQIRSNLRSAPLTRDNERIAELPLGCMASPSPCRNRCMKMIRLRGDREPYDRGGIRHNSCKSKPPRVVGCSKTRLLIVLPDTMAIRLNRNASYLLNRCRVLICRFKDLTKSFRWLHHNTLFFDGSFIFDQAQDPEN
jgi:hypothetical protein